MLWGEELTSTCKLNRCARIGKETVVKVDFHAWFDPEQVQERHDVREAAVEYMNSSRPHYI